MGLSDYRHRCFTEEWIRMKAPGNTACLWNGLSKVQHTLFLVNGIYLVILQGVRGQGSMYFALKGHSQCFRLCGLHSPYSNTDVIILGLRQPAGLGTASCRVADQSGCGFQQPVAKNMPRLPQGQIRGRHPPLPPILTLCEYP